jgi:hypothetical protein
MRQDPHHPLNSFFLQGSAPAAPEFIEGFEQRAEDIGDMELTAQDVEARQRSRDQNEAAQVAHTITGKGKRRYLPKPTTAYEAQRQAKMTGQ